MPPRITPLNHVVDPTCPAPAARHGFFAAHRYDGCVCPCESLDKFREATARNLEKDRQRRAKVKAAKVPGRVQPVEPAKGTGRWPDLPPAPPSLVALWQREDRACLGTDPELWFPVGTGSDATVREARAICRDCPCLRLCFQASMESGDDHAVLAGLLPKERRKLKENAGAAA